MLTNEAKVAKDYLNHDIVGLSIINASAAKYKAKFNAVRKHLQDMPDHPLVKLIQFFRDTLLEFLQERQTAIQKSLQFFKHDV